MDAKKINQYAYNIISLTWPKYKKHMGDRDLENIKIVEDMLLKFKNEITTEFIASHTASAVESTKHSAEHIHPKTKLDPELYETLTVVTFKSNFKNLVVPPFQIWRRNTERRITDFRLKNDPTKEIDDWSEALYTAQTILKESDETKIIEGIRNYYPDAELVNIEQIFKDKLNLVLFANFRGIVTL